MTILHKGAAASNYTWLTADLVERQIGLNVADGTLHIRKDDDSIVTLSNDNNIVDYTTRGSQSVDASSSYVLAAGVWTITITHQFIDLEIYTGSTWDGSDTPFTGGSVISDGSNVRLTNTDASAQTFSYLKQGLQR